LQLGIAFTLYSALVWQGLSLVRVAVPLPQSAKNAVLKLRGPAAAAAAIIAVTVASGAFVAGNDAGHAFNDWPFFAGRIIPEGLWDSALGLRNITENTATVQWDHRLLAYLSVGSVAVLHARIASVGSRNLPQAVRTAARVLGGLVVLQVILGVSTLVLFVPVSLGTAHQAGALALLTGAVNLLHTIRASHAAPTILGAVSGAAPVSFRAAALPIVALGACLVDASASETSPGPED
jgi:cytochrome c oxidase assembly protein subunit 15